MHDGFDYSLQWHHTLGQSLNSTCATTLPESEPETNLICKCHIFIPPFCFSVLSISGIHRERESASRRQRRPVRVPALRPENPEQPTDHVPVRPGLCLSWRTHRSYLHWWVLESPAAAEVTRLKPHLWGSLRCKQNVRWQHLPQMNAKA